MTLVLSYMSWPYVLQVSDRLVTLAGQPAQAHDLAANKTLIYGARDAIVVAGYSGVAYIDETPTDVWLAERLIDGDFGDPYDLGMSLTGLIGVHRDYSASIAALIDALRAAELSDPSLRQHGIEIGIVGYRWDRRGHARPVAWQIERADDGRYVPRFTVRRLHRDGFHLFSEGSRDEFQLRDVTELVREIANTGPRWEDVEGLLTSAIRDVAQRTDRVGDDCMSVLIPAPGWRRIHLRYLPDEASTTGVNTPLLVNAGALFLPTVVTGDDMVGRTTIARLGAFEVTLDFPMASGVQPSGLHYGFSKQTRLPPPKRTGGRLGSGPQAISGIVTAARRYLRGVRARARRHAHFR